MFAFEPDMAYASQVAVGLLVVAAPYLAISLIVLLLIKLKEVVANHPLLTWLPDMKYYSHPVVSESCTLEEFQNKMKEIYGSERSITFEEFKELLTYHKGCMRAFGQYVFEFYETGAYGCGWCTYSFSSPEDLALYHKWLDERK